MTAFAEIARKSAGWLPVIGASALLGTLGSLALPVMLGRAIDSIATGGSPRWLWFVVGLIVTTRLPPESATNQVPPSVIATPAG